VPCLELFKYTDKMETVTVKQMILYKYSHCINNDDFKIAINIEHNRLHESGKDVTYHDKWKNCAAIMSAYRKIIAHNCLYPYLTIIISFNR